MHPAIANLEWKSAVCMNIISGLRAYTCTYIFYAACKNGRFKTNLGVLIFSFFTAVDQPQDKD